MVSKGRKTAKSPPAKPRPVVVYFEGGGDPKNNNKALLIDAQQGMKSLLVRGAKRDVRVVACGGRGQTFDKFQAACHGSTVQPVLLVDAEAPVANITKPWAHLKNRDGWIAPGNVTDDHAFLMVQTMEAWLLADPASLASTLGSGFKPEKIPKWPQMEAVPKPNLYSTLESTSKACDRGAYDKGAHSFKALMLVDTERLRAVCPSADRLFTKLPTL